MIFKQNNTYDNDLFSVTLQYNNFKKKMAAFYMSSNIQNNSKKNSVPFN